MKNLDRRALLAAASAWAVAPAARAQATYPDRPITFQVDAPGSVKSFIDSGRLTVLAVCAEKRLPSPPNAPTVQEALGFPFNVSTWNTVFAPARTPRPIIDKLNATINEAIRTPELIEKAKPLEIEFVQSTPDSAKAFYEQQMAFWVPIVKASGAKVE